MEIFSGIIFFVIKYFIIIMIMGGSLSFIFHFYDNREKYGLNKYPQTLILTFLSYPALYFMIVQIESYSLKVLSCVIAIVAYIVVFFQEIRGKTFIETNLQVMLWINFTFAFVWLMYLLIQFFIF